MDKLEQIGERIKKKRLALKMTQKELGEITHCSQEAIGKYETGQRGIDPDKLSDIASALHTTRYYLLTGCQDNNAGIASEMGLNDEAISFIMKAKCLSDIEELEGSDYGGNMLAAINTLLGEKRGQQIIEDIWSFLQSDYMPPFDAVTVPGEDTAIAAVAYWQGTGKDETKHQMYISQERLAALMKLDHLSRISSSIEAWKEERAAAAESAAPKRGRKKEGAGNAAKN